MADFCVSSTGVNSEVIRLGVSAPCPTLKPVIDAAIPTCPSEGWLPRE